ncbi:Rolling stone, partial [Operophtera brumata]
MVKCYRKTVSLSDLWVSCNEKLSDFHASSWQRGDSPIPLLVVRLILAAVAVGLLTWSLVEAPSPYWLVYLTNWGLLLVTMLMLSGVLVSWMAVTKTPHDSNELPWYSSMYWLFFNISIPTALLITALYWILLYDP